MLSTLTLVVAAVKHLDIYDFLFGATEKMTFDLVLNNSFVESMWSKAPLTPNYFQILIVGLKRAEAHDSYTRTR